MIAPVPYLIDGNNLIFACKKAGFEIDRQGLCALLQVLARQARRVTVVFDGPARVDTASEQTTEGIELVFSGTVKADDIICELIAQNTAPRRLTVVSTDRQIRKAARRRRCKVQRSEQFAEYLIRLAEKPPRRPPTEPPQKRHGLTADETKAWLKEFGFDQGEDRQ